MVQVHLISPFGILPSSMQGYNESWPPQQAVMEGGIAAAAVALTPPEQDVTYE